MRVFLNPDLFLSDPGVQPEMPALLDRPQIPDRRNYALCGIGETVPELVFGDAETDRLKDVWNNNPVLNDIREGLPEELKGIWGDCLMKNMCLGLYVAMNYYRSKDLFAPHWYCEEAHNAGFFPAERIRPGSVFEYA